MADQEKAPSALSFDLFAERVAADETVPQSLKKAVADHKKDPAGSLLAVLRKAIGDAK